MAVGPLPVADKAIDFLALVAILDPFVFAVVFAVVSHLGISFWLYFVFIEFVIATPIGVKNNRESVHCGCMTATASNTGCWLVE